MAGSGEKSNWETLRAGIKKSNETKAKLSKARKERHKGKKTKKRVDEGRASKRSKTLPEIERGGNADAKHRKNVYQKSDDGAVRFANAVRREGGEDAMDSTKTARRVLGIDCEMVETLGRHSSLALVAIVDSNMDLVFHSYCRPSEKVTDYRTRWSGIRPHNIQSAPNFRSVQKRVARIIKGCIIVGHSIKHDLKALRLDHNPQLIRDTQNFYKGSPENSKRNWKLSTLAEMHLNEVIQTGEHDPAEDARATLALYLIHRKDWERQAARGSPNSARVNSDLHFSGNVRPVAGTNPSSAAAISQFSGEYPEIAEMLASQQGVSRKRKRTSGAGKKKPNRKRSKT